MVTSPSAFSSTFSVEAQISKARAEAEAASANENDLSSGSHDDDFKERVRAKWNEPEFQRGFKSFKKNFKKTLENDNTLMFQFARENSQNMNVGRKRKHGCQMSDQSINCYGKADTSSCG